MKKCNQCGQAYSLANFYKHPAMGDGHLGKCKECVKANVRANYRKNREHYRRYERERANLPHRVELRNAYAQTAEGRVAARRARRRYFERNPEKRRAHIMTGNAIRSGRLKRQPCEVCGDTRVHAHHDDYAKPLDVRWLCPRHHAEHHKMAG